MRLLFSLILCCMSFFAANGQDSLTCIKPSTARYYLEIEDEVHVLREVDSVQTNLIANLRSELLVDDLIFATYEEDEIAYISSNETLESIITLKTVEADKTERRLVKQRNMAIGAGGGALIGSIIPGVGTLGGALIGGTMGWVSIIFKKRTKVTR